MPWWYTEEHIHSILTLTLDEIEWSSSSTGCSTPKEKAPIPNEEEACWDLELVWTLEKRKILTPPEIEAWFLRHPAYSLVTTLNICDFTSTEEMWTPCLRLPKTSACWYWQTMIQWITDNLCALWKYTTITLAVIQGMNGKHWMTLALSSEHSSNELQEELRAYCEQMITFKVVLF
jgi:hypothetical protein